MTVTSTGAKVRRREVEADIGYANARIRGMRSKLLDSGSYDRLMACAGVTDLIQELMATSYRAQLEPAIIRGRTVEVADEALRSSLVQANATVLGILQPQAVRLITTILSRWDVFNLKTILRGAHNHLSQEEIVKSLVPAGEWGWPELGVLAKSDSVAAVVDTLVTWGESYAAPLRAAMPAFVRDKNLAALELTLDREWIARMSREVAAEHGPAAEVVRRVLAAQIDVSNLVMVFRMVRESVDPDRAKQFFLEGGRHVPLELYTSLASLTDVEQVMDKLVTSPYHEVLEKAALRYLAKGSISAFERALEDMLARSASAAGRGDPLGIGVAVGYLWAKQTEVTNLRIVLKGVSVGMPAERMREDLILV